VLLHDSSVKRVPGKAYNRGKELKQGAWKAEADDVAETLDMGAKFVVFNNFYDSLATVGSDCVLCHNCGSTSCCLLVVSWEEILSQRKGSLWTSFEDL
jgi:hypothetical protein